MDGVGHRLVGEQPLPGLGLGLRRRAQRPRGRGPARAGGGGVPGGLGLDLGVPGGADGDQPVQEGPARVGVHGEAGHLLRAVEQAAQHGGVLVGAGRAGEGARPQQLLVAARLALPHGGERGVGEQRPAGGRPRRVGVGAERALHPGQQRLDDAALGLRADAGEHDLHPLAGRQLGVPGHVPGGRPAQRPRQRVGHPADLLAQGAQRALVEPQLGVGEVVVVDQHEVGCGGTDEVGHEGSGTRDVELDARRPGQPVRSVAVEADGGAVVTQHRVLGDGGLLDGEGRVAAVVRELVDRAQGVDLAGPQPLVGPGRQVAAGALRQRPEQVGEGRVAVLVGAEVRADAGEELLLAHPGHQLLEHRGALGVGDPVEVDLDRGDVGDVGGDRVGRGQLVLRVRPGLLGVGERRPGGRVLGRLGLAQRADVGGEGLVEPQVVPPAHGHQVAEPHVRQLVQHGLRAALVACPAGLGPEDVVLEEGDGAGVLHRAGVELRDEELVVLVERVRVVEHPVVEVEALLGDPEELLGVQVLGQRRAAVEAERDAVVLVGDARVRAGDQRHEVGGDPLRRREMHELRAARAGLDLAVAGVGDDLPVERRGDVDGERGLEVGLVEAGEHPLGVGRLELRVEVDLAVDRVDEAVQPLAGVRVGTVRRDDQRVLLRQVDQRQAAGLGVAADVDRLAVERGRAHPLGHQVDEGGLPGATAVELHRGLGEERALPGTSGAVGDVEAQVVAVHGEQFGARGGIDTGEIGDGHRGSMPWRRSTICGDSPGRAGGTPASGGMNPATPRLGTVGTGGRTAGPPDIRGRRERGRR